MSEPALTVEERLDRLEAALAQGLAPTLGIPSPARGRELYALMTAYHQAQAAAAAARAAADRHDRMKSRDQG